MWNTGDYTTEELEVLKEREYDLFMFNPGFRAMWHDNFEEYFRGTLDEEYWQKREQEREKEIEEEVHNRMLTDPEYRQWRNELAIIEQEAFREYTDPILAKGRKFEREQISDLEHDYDNRQWEKDSLHEIAQKWGRNLGKATDKLYQIVKNINLFRISVNVNYISSKIRFALPHRHFREEDYDLEWRTDRIGYVLALTFLKRCLDSLELLRNEPKASTDFNINEYVETGKEIRQELINRLEEIEQLRFKKLRDSI